MGERELSRVESKTDVSPLQRRDVLDLDADAFIGQLLPDVTSKYFCLSCDVRLERKLIEMLILVRILSRHCPIYGGHASMSYD